MLAKFDVVNKHAAPALYNAWEMRRIPFRFIWTPISKIQELLGGKAKFYTALGLVALVALTIAMIFVPYPLKMEAKGEFLPKNTVYVYPPMEGQVREIKVRSGDRIKPDSTLVELFSADLLKKITEAEGQLNAALSTKGDYDRILSNGGLTTDAEAQYRSQQGSANSTVIAKQRELEALRKTYNAVQDRPGAFRSSAPRLDVGIPGDWQVLNSDQRSELLNRIVRGNEPLMRLGAVDGPWRVELKIPQRNIGHIARAFSTEGLHKKDALGKKYLDVDVLLTSRPDTKFPGRLYDEDMSKEAIPNRDDHNESEGIVSSPVRVNLEEFGAAGQIPPELRVAGVEVHARVRCGEHALGYSLFHGVWEWFYEKVIFFF
jgi:hypothetical protein